METKPPLNLEELRNSNNWFNFQKFYSYVASVEQYRTFVEVGVWKGHSISYLANLLRDRNAKIYAVDLFEQSYQLPTYQTEVNVVDKLYEMNLKATNTRHLITDIKEWSHKAASRFEDHSVDFVFLDADHEYQQVKRDITEWLPKVRVGGIIAGHDYHDGGPGVILAVQETFGCNFWLYHEGTVWYSIIR